MCHVGDNFHKTIPFIDTFSSWQPHTCVKFVLVFTELLFPSHPCHTLFFLTNLSPKVISFVLLRISQNSTRAICVTRVWDYPLETVGVSSRDTMGTLTHLRVRIMYTYTDTHIHNTYTLYLYAHTRVFLVSIITQKVFDYMCASVLPQVPSSACLSCLYLS